MASTTPGTPGYNPNAIFVTPNIEQLTNWNGPAQTYHTETSGIPLPPVQGDGNVLMPDMILMLTAIVTSIQRAAGFIMNIGHRLDDLTGRVNTMGTNMLSLARRVEVIENAKGGGGMGGARTRGYQNIAQLGSDKSGFRLWHERFINEITQVYPHARQVIKKINNSIDISLIFRVT